MMIENVRKKFTELFKTEPLLIASPGRVNLIGEHTDYNDGFVLPAAIDKKIIFALAPSGSDNCEIHAPGMNDQFSFSIHDIKPAGGWKNYLLGIIFHLQKKGYALQGFNCVLDGNIPMGSGLSSSAAVEGGLSFGLKTLLNLSADRLELARIGQLAEHTYVGVKCGIMDQFANLFGKKEQLIRLDCRSMEYAYFPFHFPEYKIVLCNSMVTHSLASSEYNIRRQQCEEGVKLLQKYFPQIKNLRDVSADNIKAHKNNLPEKVYSRCLYVAEENDRVLQACDFLQQNNLSAFGKLMFATHEGLSRQYEVSCNELDYLVMMAQQRSEVIGARMMGGGFGGCTINIVQAGAVENFTAFIIKNYQQKFNKIPEIYITSIEEGVHRVIPTGVPRQRDEVEESPE